MVEQNFGEISYVIGSVAWTMRKKHTKYLIQIFKKRGIYQMEPILDQLEEKMCSGCISKAMLSYHTHRRDFWNVQRSARLKIQLQNHSSLKFGQVIIVLISIKEYSKLQEDDLYYVPLVLNPIQFRYLHSFLEIYVFPRAGSPTIATNCGTSK